MSKALNFDKSSELGDESGARRIPNAGEVKGFFDRALAQEKEIDGLKEDLKQIYQDAHDQGIDRKALRFVVKHKKNPISIEHRQEVNETLTKVGEQAMFAFA